MAHMEHMSFSYGINGDDNNSHSANVGFGGEYIALDEVAGKFKDFLNAAGYSVKNVGIDTGAALFVAVDEDSDED